MFWNFSIGNDLYNNTKYFTDFWTFNGNKSSRLRDQSWTLNGDNSNAILPMLNMEDNYSGAYSSSYYVEDASFLRLKNLVLGYSLPKELLQEGRYPESPPVLTSREYPYDHRIYRLRPRVYQRLFTAKRFWQRWSRTCRLKKRSRYGRLANNHAVLIGREFYFLNHFI